MLQRHFCANTKYKYDFKRHYISNTRGSYAHGRPKGVDFTFGQVTVHWEVESTTKQSRYDVKRDKKSQLLLPSKISFGRPPRCGHVTSSTTKASKLTAPSTITHDLAMALRTTTLSLVRWELLVQNRRCCFPILYTAVYLNFQRSIFLKKA